jgi:separase
MQQALRLWNRAADALGRLSSSRTTSADMSNPFDMSNLKEALPATDNPSDSNLKRSLNFRKLHDGLEWRIADGLLGTLLSLVDVYFARGSPREACYFAQQAQDLAECLNAPAMVGRALAKKGEIELCRGRLAEIGETIALTEKFAQDLPETSTIEIYRLHADYNCRIDELEDAHGLYERARFIVENLDKSISSFDISLKYVTFKKLHAQRINSSQWHKEIIRILPRTVG